MDVSFERAVIDDAEVLVNVRNQSFCADYIKYGECPGYNNLIDSMANTILNRIAYKIICNNQIVGNLNIMNIDKDKFKSKKFKIF